MNGDGTYIPKANKGWIRVPQPLTLRTLSMKQILKSLSIIDHPTSEAKESQLRDHIGSNLLQPFFGELIQLSHHNLLKPQSLVNLLLAFPTKTFETSIDLLGFYEGTECCKPDNSTNWIYGFIPDICIDIPTCKNLFRLLMSIDLTKLQTLAFWAEEKAIKMTSIPFILTKTINLTRLVIRGDADDHLLRIIGGNCHFLKFLDVARSNRVTNIGLLNLILKKPIRKKQILEPNELIGVARRRIASSLQTITITSSGISMDTLLILAKLLDIVYITSQLPEIQLRRPNLITLLNKDLIWNHGGLQHTILKTIFESWIENNLWNQLEEILKFTLNTFGDCLLDIYNDQSQSSLLIYSHQMNKLLIKSFYNVSFTLGLTHLAMYWDTFNWDLADIIQFTDIVSQAPNLKRLESRICGSWEGPIPIFHYLTEIHCWTLDDITVISFLKSCPKLKIIDIKNVRALEDGWERQKLTHSVLLEIMNINPKLWPCVEEFIIRPTNLIKESVFKLIEMCPKLTRIGDLECWDVTEEGIRELNTFLYNKQSQCVIVVLSFPPRRN